jgi:hypothetical protein
MKYLFIILLILTFYIIFVLLCSINLTSYGKVTLLHDCSLDNVVNQNNIRYPQINVGDKPIRLAINQVTNTVYIFLIAVQIVYQ